MILNFPPAQCRFFPDFVSVDGVPYVHRPARVDGTGMGVYDQVIDQPSLALLGDMGWPVVRIVQ